MTGIRTEKVTLHRRPVRRHHDQVGADVGGFFEHFVIDAALTDDDRNAPAFNSGFARNNCQRFF
ncbi:Uncharacterised protein [Mycobacterium tuberculosis]|nr:Uncharacterised protein [Mycobacterium tuberculosis]